MARYVKIASLGEAAPAVAPGTPPLEVADRMIRFWAGHFAAVLPDKPDLIVVPEVCDRPGGWSREDAAAYYRARGEKVLDFFRQTARDNETFMVYSAGRAMRDGSMRNASVLIDRAGDIVGEYRKNHLTIDEMEIGGNLCGACSPVFDTEIGRIGFAICFDLNFDKLRARYAALSPDLIVFCSAYHGGLMQRVWAYSCRAWFVGAIGARDCPSAILRPTGETLAESSSYFRRVVATINLDCRLAHLDYNRGERFTALKRKYGPLVTIDTPSYLGSALISSEHPDVSVDQMFREFEIEALDDYLERARGYHRDPRWIEPS